MLELPHGYDRERRIRRAAPMGLGGIKSHFGGGVTNPITILGAALLAWYRADLLVTSSLGKVSAWGDSSGTGDSNKNAVQATGALQPTLNATNASYNNQSTITFPDSTLLLTGTWAVPIAQPTTRFVVCHAGANSDFVMDSQDAANEYAIFCDTCALFDGATLDSGVTLIATPSIIWVIDNGNSSKIGVRQNTAQATGAAGTKGAASLTIGNTAGGGALSLAGPIAEIVIASGALSQVTINLMTAYLASRYGLTQGP